MPTQRDKPYHHGDLRRALIAATLELLEEEGGAALDLRKAARKAGVSHAAPYRHFADKRALLAAVAEEGFMQLTAELQNALNSASSDRRLFILAQTYVQFALKQPALMREMFSGLIIDRMAYETLHSASKSALAVLVETIQSEQAAGAIVNDDPAQLAMVVWSMMHGLAMLIIENQMPMFATDPNQIDHMVKCCIASLYDGIRPR